MEPKEIKKSNLHWIPLIFLTLHSKLDPLTLVSSTLALSEQGRSANSRVSMGKNTCVVCVWGGGELRSSYSGLYKECEVVAAEFEANTTLICQTKHSDSEV